MIPLALLLACAPLVAPSTMQRLVAVESGGDALALNVNGFGRLYPADRADAVRLARAAIASGRSVDLGLAQVNSRNLDALGYTVEQMFDPCTNLHAGSRVLYANYTAAAARFGEGQRALDAALSAYNTGHFARGLVNGYVARVRGRRPASVPSIFATPTRVPVCRKRGAHVRADQLAAAAPADLDRPR